MPTRAPANRAPEPLHRCPLLADKAAFIVSIDHQIAYARLPALYAVERGAE